MERLKRVYNVPTKTVTRKKMVPITIPGHVILGKNLTYNDYKKVFYTDWFEGRLLWMKSRNGRLG